MTTHSSPGHDLRGWPQSRVGRRAVTLAGLCVAGVVLLVVAFALNVVEPAGSYTDSWAQLVWGLGIWACGIGAVVTGLVAMVRHHERSWMVALATVLGLIPLALLLSEIALGKF
jgi:MFS family permease